MDPQRGVCIGCYRTLDEIARWAGMTEMERAGIMSVLPTRRPSSTEPSGISDPTV